MAKSLIDVELLASLVSKDVAKSLNVEISSSLQKYIETFVKTFTTAFNKQNQNKQASKKEEKIENANSAVSLLKDISTSVNTSLTHLSNIDTSISELKEYLASRSESKPGIFGSVVEKTKSFVSSILEKTKEQVPIKLEGVSTNITKEHHSQTQPRDALGRFTKDTQDNTSIQNKQDGFKSVLESKREDVFVILKDVNKKVWKDLEIVLPKILQKPFEKLGKDQLKGFAALKQSVDNVDVDGGGTDIIPLGGKGFFGNLWKKARTSGPGKFIRKAGAGLGLGRAGRMFAPAARAATLGTAGIVGGGALLAGGAYAAYKGLTTDDADKGVDKVVGRIGATTGAKLLAGGLAKTAGTKIGAKLGTAAVGKAIATKIPFVGAALGLGFAVSRFSQGDFFGGFIDILSGIASIFPGIGTGISFALDALNAAGDMKSGGTGTAGKNKAKADFFTAPFKWIGKKIYAGLKSMLIIGPLIKAFEAIQSEDYKEAVKQLAYTFPVFDVIGAMFGDTKASGVAKATGSVLGFIGKMFKWVGKKIYDGLKSLLIIGPLIKFGEELKAGNFGKALKQLAYVFPVFDVLGGILGDKEASGIAKTVASPIRLAGKLAKWIATTAYKGLKSLPVIGPLLKVGEELSSGNFGKALKQLAYVFPPFEFIGALLGDKEASGVTKVSAGLVKGIGSWIGDLMGWVGEKVYSLISNLPVVGPAIKAAKELFSGNFGKAFKQLLYVNPLFEFVGALLGDEETGAVVGGVAGAVKGVGSFIGSITKWVGEKVYSLISNLPVVGPAIKAAKELFSGNFRKAFKQLLYVNPLFEFIGALLGDEETGAVVGGVAGAVKGVGSFIASLTKWVGEQIFKIPVLGGLLKGLYEIISGQGIVKGLITMGKSIPLIGSLIGWLSGEDNTEQTLKGVTPKNPFDALKDMVLEKARSWWKGVWGWVRWLARRVLPSSVIKTLDEGLNADKDDKSIEGESTSAVGSAVSSVGSAVGSVVSGVGSVVSSVGNFLFGGEDKEKQPIKPAATLEQPKDKKEKAYTKQRGLERAVELAKQMGVEPKNIQTQGYVPTSIGGKPVPEKLLTDREKDQIDSAKQAAAALMGEGPTPISLEQKEQTPPQAAQPTTLQQPKLNPEAAYQHAERTGAVSKPEKAEETTKQKAQPEETTKQKAQPEATPLWAKALKGIDYVLGGGVVVDAVKGKGTYEKKQIERAKETGELLPWQTEASLYPKETGQLKIPKKEMLGVTPIEDKPLPVPTFERELNEMHAVGAQLAPRLGQDTMFASGPVSVIPGIIRDKIKENQDKQIAPAFGPFVPVSQKSEIELPISADVAPIQASTDSSATMRVFVDNFSEEVYNKLNEILNKQNNIEEVKTKEETIPASKPSIFSKVIQTLLPSLLPPSLGLVLKGGQVLTNIYKQQQQKANPLTPSDTQQQKVSPSTTSNTQQQTPERSIRGAGIKGEVLPSYEEREKTKTWQTVAKLLGPEKANEFYSNKLKAQDIKHKQIDRAQEIGKQMGLEVSEKNLKIESNKGVPTKINGETIPEKLYNKEEREKLSAKPKQEAPKSFPRQILEKYLGSENAELFIEKLKSPGIGAARGTQSFVDILTKGPGIGAARGTQSFVDGPGMGLQESPSNSLSQTVTNFIKNPVSTIQEALNVTFGKNPQEFEKNDATILTSIAENTENTTKGLNRLAQNFDKLAVAIEHLGGSIGQRDTQQPIVMSGGGEQQRQYTGTAGLGRGVEYAKMGNQENTRFRELVEQSRQLPV